MSRMFLDAGVAIAAGLKRDQRHGEIAQLWPRLLQEGTRLTTTSFVVDEVVTFLNGKREHAAAITIGKILINSPHVELIHIDQELFAAGWDFFVQHVDKRYSLTDCISFVVMQERGLRQALTFDRHFAQAGFECVPGATAGG